MYYYVYSENVDEVAQAEGLKLGRPAFMAHTKPYKCEADIMMHSQHEFGHVESLFPQYGRVKYKSLLQPLNLRCNEDARFPEGLKYKYVVDVSPLMCVAELHPNEITRVSPDREFILNTKSQEPLGDVSVTAKGCPFHWVEQDYINYLRMAVGMHKALPKQLHWIYGVVPVELFVHVSKTEPNKVAYCLPGKEVKTTIGRFLRKFAEVPLTGKQLQQVSEDYLSLINFEYKLGDNKPIVKVGTSEDDFEAAYQVVESCMTANKMEDHYISIHPARAYATGDFAVYGVWENGKCVARALVNTIHNEFWNVYPKDGSGSPDGEDARYLQAYLLDKGFKRSQGWARDGSLNLQWDSQCDAFTVPYVDQGDWIYRHKDGSDRWIIDPSDTSDWERFMGATAAYDSNFKVNEDGDASDDGAENCEHCGDRTDTDYLSVVYRDGSSLNVCSYCRDNHYRYVENMQEHYHEDEVTYSEYNREYFVDDDEDYVYIDRLSDYVHTKDLVLCINSQWEVDSDVTELYDGEVASYYDEDSGIVEMYDGRMASERYHNLDFFTDESVREGECFPSDEIGGSPDIVELYDGQFAHEDDVLIEFFDLTEDLYGEFAFEDDDIFDMDEPDFLTVEDAVIYHEEQKAQLKLFHRLHAYAA